MVKTRFEFTASLREFQNALKELDDEAVAVAGAGLGLEARKLINASIKQVPVDKGILKASATVDGPIVEDKVVSYVVGYGGQAKAYAEAVHDNPRAGKTGGFSPSGLPYKTWSKVGKWHYLTDPAREQAKSIDRSLGRFIANFILRRGWPT